MMDSGWSPPPWLTSATVAFRGLSSSDKMSALLHLMGELNADERHVWQGTATSYLHRDFVSFLPPELSSHLLSMLGAATLFTCCRVSKVWKGKVEADLGLWNSLAKGQGGNMGPEEVDVQVHHYYFLIPK